MKARVEATTYVEPCDLNVDFELEGKDRETLLHEAATVVAETFPLDEVQGVTVVVLFDYTPTRDASSSEPSSQDAAGSPAASASSGPNA